MNKEDANLLGMSSLDDITLDDNQTLQLDGQSITIANIVGQNDDGAGFSSLDIGHQRPRDASWVDSVMMLEIAVFNGLQACHQQWRHLGDLYQRAVFFLQGVDRRYFGRIQAEQAAISARLEVTNPVDSRTGKLNRHALLS